MTVKFANNATSTIVGSISTSDTAITLATGDGAKYPTLTTGEYFYATLYSSDTVFEIVKVTARSGDVLTVVRAQENTSALSWTSGTPITNRITAQALKDNPSNVLSLNSNGVFKGLIKQDSSVVMVQEVGVITAIPAGYAPSGTVGANGALTLGTSLGITYSAIWLYFPAGAVYSGSTAGMYYTVMTSGTVGTVYNNKYVDVFGTVSSPTAISDAGPGAYTSGTGGNLTLLTYTIPANRLGANGAFSATIFLVTNTTSGTKQLRAVFDGTQTYTNTLSTAGGAVITLNTKNISTSQLLNTASGSVTRTSVNTTVDKVLNLTINMSAATDYAIIDGFTLTYTT